MISTVAEKKLERDVIKAFKEVGWYARHVDPSPGEAGFPDVLAICGDKYALVELKTKTTLMASQKIWSKRHGNIVRNRFIIADGKGTDFIYKITAYPTGVAATYDFSYLSDCIKKITMIASNQNES